MGAGSNSAPEEGGRQLSAEPGGKGGQKRKGRTQWRGLVLVAAVFPTPEWGKFTKTGRAVKELKRKARRMAGLWYGEIVSFLADHHSGRPEHEPDHCRWL